MTLCADSFGEFLQPLEQRLQEKISHIENLYGPYRRWDWDSEAVTLTFHDSTKHSLRIEVTIVGTTQDDSWEWSWGNPNFAPDLTRDMEKVRAFGQVHGFEKLTSVFLDAGEDTGWEMTAGAAHVLNAPGAYRFSIGQGHCYLLYRKIEEVAQGIDLNAGAEDSWGR